MGFLKALWSAKKQENKLKKTNSTLKLILPNELQSKIISTTQPSATQQEHVLYTWMPSVHKSRMYYVFKCTPRYVKGKASDFFTEVAPQLCEGEDWHSIQGSLLNCFAKLMYFKISICMARGSLWNPLTGARSLPFCIHRWFPNMLCSRLYRKPVCN